MSFRVSICIPAYNQTVFLRKTLESIREQTFRDFEVIVSDDSTNDLVRQLVMEFESDFKISYQHNSPGLGSPANWNKCLDLAKGNLIKFMHHDDWFKSPDSLQKFVNPFNDPEIIFAFCASEILDVSTNSISYNRPPESYVDLVKNDPFKLFCDNRIGAPTATLFRAGTLRFDARLKYVVDIDFYIRHLQNNKSLFFISEPLIVNTSNHQGQVTQASLNKETQVGEYAYLYSKLKGAKIPGKDARNLFVSLFRKYKIKSLREVRNLSGVLLKPAWYFKLLLLRSRM